jgi:hypothetical protein
MAERLALRELPAEEEEGEERECRERDPRRGEDERLLAAPECYSPAHSRSHGWSRSIVSATLA